MPGKVIGTEMLLGYPGTVSRNIEAVISSRVVKTAAILFGFPVILNTDNTYSKFGAANVAADFAGIAVREVKQADNFTDTVTSYAVGAIADVIEKGSVSVICAEGTPTAGGKVYVCTVAGTTAAVGDLLATSSPAGQGATAVELTNCRWKTGKIDANKISELTILNRNNP